MESWEVAHDAVGIGLPDGEGVVDVPDVNHQIIVSNEHSLGSQVRDRIEFVVQGIRFLSGKEQIIDIVKICPHTWYSSYMTTETSGSLIHSSLNKAHVRKTHTDSVIEDLIKETAVERKVNFVLLAIMEEWSAN